MRELLGSLRYTTDEMARPAAGLSGGQRAKLLLAALALSGANVLVLDEPTRNLSPLSGPALRRALRAFPGADHRRLARPQIHLRGLHPRSCCSRRRGSSP